MADKILFIACGDRKHATPAGPVPALDFYAGRQFVLARRLEALGWSVYIMSAKHGLVPAARPLAWYDQRMTRDRAQRCIANIETGRSVSTAQYAAATAGAARVVFYGGELYFRIWWALDAVAGRPTYNPDCSRCCDTSHIVGAGCGEHYSVLKEIVAEEEAAAALAA